MRLTELINRKAIIANLKSKDKQGAIKELVQVIKKAHSGEKYSVNELVEAILEREKRGSTGMGGGVALPHAKFDSVKGVIGAFGRAPAGMNFNAVDGASVDLIFMVLAPTSRNDDYLKALRQLMNAVRRPHFTKFLRSAKNAREIEEVFRDTEEVARV